MLSQNGSTHPETLLRNPLAPDPKHTLPQRVQGTSIVECRVSILGITIMIWGSIPHNST